METYEAVTPNGKESEIGKVKVRKVVSISAATLAKIKEAIPDFTIPEPEMFRLESLLQLT